MRQEQLMHTLRSWCGASADLQMNMLKRYEETHGKQYETETWLEFIRKEFGIEESEDSESADIFAPGTYPATGGDHLNFIR